MDGTGQTSKARIVQDRQTTPIIVNMQIRWNASFNPHYQEQAGNLKQEQKNNDELENKNIKHSLCTWRINLDDMEKRNGKKGNKKRESSL